jgi:hypothetical protein
MLLYYLKKVLSSNLKSINECPKQIFYFNKNDFILKDSRLFQSSNSTSKKENSDESNEFQKETKSKVQYLEQFGIIKKHASWPQYNRIIYPPCDENNGTLVKNPVK